MYQIENVLTENKHKKDQGSSIFPNVAFNLSFYSLLLLSSRQINTKIFDFSRFKFIQATNDTQDFILLSKYAITTHWP